MNEINSVLYISIPINVIAKNGKKTIQYILVINCIIQITLILIDFKRSSSLIMIAFLNYQP